jgi:MFS family permease
LAVAAGPTLGGFLVTHFGWPSIFYVNLLVGVIALILSLLIVPDLRPGRRHRLDISGVLLATAGLLGITFGLIEGQRYDWGRVFSFVTIPEIIGAGLVLMVVFLVLQYLRQEEEPLLPFSIFGDRNYALMNVVAAALGFAMLGLFLPLTIYYQSVLGLTALEAGLTIVVQPLVMMFVAPVAGSLADRMGGKYLLMGGLILFSAGMAYIDWISQPDSGRWSFLPGLILAGVGLGFTWAPLFSIAMRDVEPGWPVSPPVSSRPSRSSAACSPAPSWEPCSRTGSWPLCASRLSSAQTSSLHSSATASWTASAMPPGAVSR